MNQEQKNQVKEAADLVEQAQTIMENLREELHQEFEELGEKAQEGKTGEKLNAEMDMIEGLDFDDLIATIQDVGND